MLTSDLVIDNVLQLAAREPNRLFARVIVSGQPDRRCTYFELIGAASKFASHYQARGVQRGDVVVINLPHGEELLFAFVGAMLAGAVPSVFAHPSPKTHPTHYRETLTQLLKTCQTRHLVTSQSVVDVLQEAARELEVIFTQDVATATSTFQRPAGLDAADLVLLQHSSGTTGIKKGVALSNRAVTQQLRQYASAIDLRASDHIASWLPLYHDMGLITSFLLPMTCGVPVTLRSPFDWLTDPLHFLESMGEDRTTLCWMPNFAYLLLASRVRSAASRSIDLSSVRAFINCAEPIRAEAHDAFFAAFCESGLRREALTTCYALAENTFAATQGGIRNPVRLERLDEAAFAAGLAQPALDQGAQTRCVVSSGAPLASVQIQVVNAERQPLPDRRIGEILIKSDCMLTGYFNRPDLNERLLVDGWYCTGDLGYLSEGHLFVTGRIKDLIIVAGRNLYPEDFEAIANSVPGVVPGRTVAFGLARESAGTEEVVLMAETRENEPARHAAIRLAIARQVKERMDLSLTNIVILPHMWLAKSSSGKIARTANWERYRREGRALP